MIIGIGGHIGSGKDTAGEMIQLMAPNENFEIRKFAGKLKEIASILTGIPIERFEDQQFKQQVLGHEWDIVKEIPMYDPVTNMEFIEKSIRLMTVRELLQKLGTDAIRDGLHKDAWVNATFADYSKNKNWIITDVRFPNEVAAIRKRNGILILIKRDNYINMTGNSHDSETALNNFYDWDHVIDNNYSFSDLRNSLRFALKNYLELS